MAGSPATAFRVALLVLCSLLSVVAAERTYAALPVALLAGFALSTELVPAVRRHPVVAVAAEAGFTGLAVALTGGADSPMLPYLLAPGLALGLAGSWRHVVLAAGASAVGLAVGRGLYESDPDRFVPAPLSDFLVVGPQWVALGLAFGLVAGWGQRLTVMTPNADDRYDEARRLLEQLRGVTRRLPGGLDVPSSAETLLQRCAEIAPSDRSAVLVQPAPGALVPAAVRGTQRVPWRTPLSEPGPLRQAWDSREAVIDRRQPDVAGRRKGSTLAVLPLSIGEDLFGLVVLESFAEGAFDDEAVAALCETVSDGALRLATALLFDEVRSTVTVEERDRLAREMHDGVAQELAYVGYQLDDLRLQAVKVDDGLAERIAEVRKGLTRLISDIRLSITDLKTSVGSDRGLGAALTSYVRAVGSGQKVAVHVSLEESAFRLPADQEVALFRVAQAVAQDVRRTGQATNLWVTLAVDPPSARLHVEHDGPTGDAESLGLTELVGDLERLGGSLHVAPGKNGGVRVEGVLGGS